MSTVLKLNGWELLKPADVDAGRMTRNTISLENMQTTNESGAALSSRTRLLTSELPFVSLIREYRNPTIADASIVSSTTPTASTSK